MQTQLGEAKECLIASDRERTVKAQSSVHGELPSLYSMALMVLRAPVCTLIRPVGYDGGLLKTDMNITKKSVQLLVLLTVIKADPFVVIIGIQQYCLLAFCG